MMLLTIPSHIVIASVPNGWPNIPQLVDATADDGSPLPAEKIYDVLDDGTRRELAGMPARYFRVDDEVMIWIRLGTFPAFLQASYLVFAQALRRDPTRTRLNRFLPALKTLTIIDKEWRVTETNNVWSSPELDADSGPRANRVRTKWPDTWYPSTGQPPVYDTTHPIVGCLYAM